MKRTFEIFITVMCLIMSGTVTLRAQQPTAERKKVGLVLSGGGAKGVAHIGVLKVLEKAGIPVDYVAGTSMGAIVGGLYSIGYTPDELDSLVRNQDWMDLLSDKVSRENKTYSAKQSNDTYMASFPISDKKITVPSGLLAGQNVLNMLNELAIGYHEMKSFDDLPIPFACVSYDMTRGEEYVARSGNLPQAIRASMSIPGAFTPVRIDSMVLVDGGIYNNFPTDVATDMGADIIIGVDLFGGLKNEEQLGSIMGMIDQITTFLGREKYENNLNTVDLYMHPDITPYTSASFTSEAVDSLILRGERVAMEHWDEIIALKDKIGITDNYIPRPVKSHAIDSDSLYIGAIHFEGLKPIEEKRMREYIKIDEYTTITKRQLNDAINQIRGSNSFSFVTFKLNNQIPYDLTIIADEKRRGTINVGFRFDSEAMAAILLNTTLSRRDNIYSPSASITARLSDNPYVRLTGSSGRIGFGNLGLSLMLRHNDFTFYNGETKTNSVTFTQSQANLYFSDVYLRSFNMSVGAQYEYLDYRAFLYAEGTQSEIVEPHGYINYFLNTHYETLDDAYYPTRGSSLRGGITVHTDNGLTVEKKTPYMSVNYELETTFSFNDRLTLIPVVSGRTLIGNNVAYPYMNCVGGNEAGRYMSQQIPFVGIRHIEIADNSVLIGALNLRARLWKKHYVTAKVNYAIQNDKFIDMFNFDNELWGFGGEYSYETPVGPIKILLSGTKNNFSGLYFSFGKYF